MIRAPRRFLDPPATNAGDRILAFRLGLEDLRTRLLILEWQDDANANEIDMLRRTIAEWESQQDAFTTPEEDDPQATIAQHIQRQAAARGDLVADQQVVPKADCVICLESFESHANNKLRCNHEMCDQCLREMFMRATDDRLLMPAKCCDKAVAHNRVYNKHKKILSHAECEQYRARRVEFAQARPVYCSNTRCGSFIAPEHIEGDVAVCHMRKGRNCRCRVKTCIRCRGEAHAADDTGCPNKDEATIALESLATERGWRQCARCHHFVELSFGCNHMTCRCGYEICYECAAPWNTYECELWDENRLER